ncbi:MAG: hypothetical protein EOO50_06315 [Flavobacterium sp.]|uniref:endo alpha-1,4 polygalactosaminidase n=1 Tax=Flavobacterium sp. TaxID=239 RepID=UPI0011F555D0|nr:endo alpha-1,4 polygalactosaminidase [Flavobacterium sp.]RZJ67354.1 MAG: hypothetical protein EOO50_06315 [Flavobacterium sp.]
MRLTRLFLFLLPSLVSANTIAPPVAKSSVLVCYGRLDPEEIKGYSYVILESQFYNIYEIRKIKSQNEKVVAYISIGEVNANAPHYKDLKDHTAGKNEIWDSYYLDLKSEKTVSTLLRIMDGIMEKGYDGLFLDNVDNYTTFGAQPNQKADLVNLLKKMSETYPDKIFIQNAGLELAAETAPYVDALLMESIATNYTFDDKTYKLRNEADFKAYVAKLDAINKNQNLPILLIEYADTEKLYKQVVHRIKSLGYDYFIGSIELQTMPKFN